MFLTALYTLLNMLFFVSSSLQYIVQETVIRDAPRFPHRGILLDTSRHFLKKEIILEHLVMPFIMSFNVFHTTR